MTTTRRRLPIYNPPTHRPTGTNRKRIVHASGKGLEIVQYQKPTTWMLEATPTSDWTPGHRFTVDNESRVLTNRRQAHITPDWAAGLVVQLDITHYPGRAGGNAFDRAITRRQPSPNPEPAAEPWATQFCSDCGRAFNQSEWVARVPNFDYAGRALHAACLPAAKLQAAQEIALEEAERADRPTWLTPLATDPVFN